MTSLVVVPSVAMPPLSAVCLRTSLISFRRESSSPLRAADLAVVMVGCLGRSIRCCHSVLSPSADAVSFLGSVPRYGSGVKYCNCSTSVFDAGKIAPIASTDGCKSHIRTPLTP